jgi:hypothetical protein
MAVAGASPGFAGRLAGWQAGRHGNEAAVPRFLAHPESELAILLPSHPRRTRRCGALAGGGWVGSLPGAGVAFLQGVFPFAVSVPKAPNPSKGRRRFTVTSGGGLTHIRRPACRL